MGLQEENDARFQSILSHMCVNPATPDSWMMTSFGSPGERSDAEHLVSGCSNVHNES